MRNHIAVLLIYVFCSTIIIGCKPKNYYLLSEKEMSSFLVELYLTEGSFDINYIKNSEKRQSYYQSLLNKYNITQTDFEKSAAWYAKKPKRLELIYEDVILRLKNIQTQVNNNIFHSEIKKDTTTIDTLDIWPIQRKFNLHRDSVYSKIDVLTEDTCQFSNGDKLHLSLQQKADTPNIIIAQLQMIILFPDNTSDTIKQYFKPKVKWQKANLNFNNLKMSKPIGVKIELNGIDTLDTKQPLQIDSISLLRIYYKE